MYVSATFSKPHNRCKTPVAGRRILLVVFFCLGLVSSQAQRHQASFNVIGFYTAKNDLAHISFVHEANHWFAAMANKFHFQYDSTQDWNNLNDIFLSRYQVVIFLDTRPDVAAQRVAFEKYMEGGGAWMGFHFSAFALTPSAYPQNWDWYHNHFIGSGAYVSNTWRPTAAVLKIEDRKHPATKHLGRKLTSAPNEWYRWQANLRTNPDINVLASIHPSSFPLGTGPRPHEIWHSGDYPVVWTNTRYRMIYFNMGHNDMDYDGGTNAELSHTFGHKQQDRFILNALLWLGRKNQHR